MICRKTVPFKFNKFYEEFAVSFSKKYFSKASSKKKIYGDVKFYLNFLFLSKG